MRIDNWFEAKIKITKIGLLQLFLTSLDALLSTSPKQQDIYIGDGNIDTCLFKMETLYYTVFSSFIIIKIMIIDHFFVNFDNFKIIKTSFIQHSLISDLLCIFAIFNSAIVPDIQTTPSTIN